MMTVPSAVSASSSSWSAPRRSSPSSRPSAAASPWRSVVFLTPAMRSARHSQVVEAARVKRMTPMISAFKSVRRHLIGKFSSPFQRVVRPTHVPGFICSCLFLLSRYCTVRNLFTGAARFPEAGVLLGLGPFSCPYSSECVERLSEKGKRSLPCSLTEHQNGTFRPIFASQHVQIRAQSVVRTPFRTVSEGEFSEVRGSKLPPLGQGLGHRDGAMRALDERL